MTPAGTVARGHGPEKVSWTSPRKGNAWLALDRNGNGVIDDGSELFGSCTPQPRSQDGLSNGFRALALSERTDRYGNQFRYRGDIIERDGGRHRRTIWDVILVRGQ